MSTSKSGWSYQVPWLRNLPDDWRVVRFGAISRLSTRDNTAGDYRLLSLSSVDGVVPKTYEDENQVRSGIELRRYWEVRPPQLVVNPMWLAQGAIGISRISGVISPDYRVYDLSDELEPAFVHHLLRSSEYRSLYALFVRGSTTYDRRVSKEDFHSLPIVIPPISTQRLIAGCLDWKIATSSELVRKKERLIDFLQEKRKALVTHAVTRGLNPDASMRAVESEWVRAIPSHWSILPLRRRLVGIEQGWSPQCENRPAEESEWAVLKVGCVNGGEFKPEENKALPSSELPVAELEIKKGDFLVSRANTRELVGSAAIVRETRERLLLCDKLFRLRFRSDIVDPGFLALAFESAGVRQQIEQDATGASDSMQNIGQGAILGLQIAWPPLEEQRAIDRHTRAMLSRLRTVQERLRKQIVLLQEYRRALISEAVTGQLDMSAAEAA